jgi:DNA polymerase III subunit delta
VALIWGESSFLIREAGLELFGEARPTVIPAREWIPGATADLATPSLFGEARAVLVTDAQDLAEDAVAEIARYAEQPEPGARLVLAAIVGPRAKGPPRSLGSALKDRVEVRRAAVERRDLPGWVTSRAAETHGMDAEPRAASTLIETVGEDPAALDQALAQLAAGRPGERLTAAAVREQFRGFGDRRVWELTDAAFSRNEPAALRTLTGLLEAREEPLMILGGIASRLRDLLRVRALPPRMAPAQAARQVGLRFDWQVRRFREQARRFTEAELQSIHGRVVEADGLLKQGGAGDVVLSMVVMAIAGSGGSPATEGAGPAPAAVGGVRRGADGRIRRRPR